MPKKPPHQSLDSEEKKLSKMLKHASSTKDKDIINRAREAAAKHRKKSETITLRVSPFDLDAIRHHADDMGMPYQTYVNVVLHKIATGEINIQVCHNPSRRN